MKINISAGATIIVHHGAVMPAAPQLAGVFVATELPGPSRSERWSHQQYAHAPVSPEHARLRQTRAAAEELRKRTPCAWLGPATGKTHKVSCGNQGRLAEHTCLHGDREGRLGPRSGKYIPPKAVPGGRCRDLDGKLLVACIDCPLYRAGLLSADTAAGGEGRSN